MSAPGRRQLRREQSRAPLLSVASTAPAPQPVLRPCRDERGVLPLQALRRDGLTPGGNSEEEFRLAQFDALNSLNTRRSEVWVTLEEHLW